MSIRGNTIKEHICCEAVHDHELQKKRRIPLSFGMIGENASRHCHQLPNRRDEVFSVISKPNVVERPFVEEEVFPPLCFYVCIHACNAPKGLSFSSSFLPSSEKSCTNVIVPHACQRGRLGTRC